MSKPSLGLTVGLLSLAIALGSAFSASATAAEAVPSETCLACHGGSLEALAEKTKD